MRGSAVLVGVSAVATAMLASFPALAQARTRGFFFEVGTGAGVLGGDVGYDGPVVGDGGGSRRGSSHDGMLGVTWNLQIAAGWGLAPHWTGGVGGEADYAPWFPKQAAFNSMMMVSPELFGRWDAEPGRRSGWWMALRAGAVLAGSLGSGTNLAMLPGDQLDASAYGKMWGPAGGLAVGYAIRSSAHDEWGPRLALRLGHAQSQHGSLTYGAVVLGIVLGRR